MERSPVFSLFCELSSAPFTAAPEKAEELRSVTDPITLLFDDQIADFRFAATTDKDERLIRVSAGALNVLWCASYAYWLLYRGVVDAQSAGRAEYRVSENPTVADALRLSQWAFQSAVECKLEPWPVEAPKPVRSPEPNSPVHVANTVFLVAVGWILLHEIGHHYLGHPREAIGPASKQEEHDADHFATDWLLGEVSDSALLLMRSLGITVAIVSLITLDLQRTSFEGYSHPPSYERLQRNLRERQLQPDQPVHAFAGVILQATLKAYGVDIHVDLDATFSGLVDDLTYQLHRYVQGVKHT